MKKRRRNPSLGNDPSVFRKHASLRILQDQIYKDKGQLVSLDTLREMILDMAKQARTASWKVVEGGKRRANPGRDAAATAVTFLRKYGSQALGWAKTAASIHRGLRDRIFWRKVYNCILRSLKRGDPLPNPGPERAGPKSFGKRFVIQTPVGPAYRVDGAAVRKRWPDGVAGWHRRAGYPFIRGDEIWIEKMHGGAAEERFMLAHEMVEILLMLVHKWTYQKAHDTANRYEKRLRNGECPKVVFESYLERHYPKAPNAVIEKYADAFYRAYKGYR